MSDLPPGLWAPIQLQLLPMLQQEFGGLSETDQRFIKILALVKVGSLLERYAWKGNGCPPHERTWLLHAFIAKAVYQISTSRALVEALKARPRMRQLCGWDSVGEVPSESTFSRAFAQFAADQLLQVLHERMVKEHCGPKLVGHISRDSTAIAARERPAPVEVPATGEPNAVAPVRFKRGRPKKGELRPPAPIPKLQVQSQRSLAENLADLPQRCDSGGKANSQGHMEFWGGYKFHLDTIDGDIPISPILTSASTHDTQSAIPLMQMSAERVRSLYQLMDAAYDAQTIIEFARALGQVPIIEPKQRGQWIPLDPAERQRFHERSASERVFSQLKDSFGGRNVRVRGASKVMCHLMFGVLAITAINLWNRLC